MPALEVLREVQQSALANYAKVPEHSVYRRSVEWAESGRDWEGERQESRGGGVLMGQT